MRNGNAVAQAGRTEALARQQVGGDDRPRDRVMVLEQQAGLLEQTLLACRLDIDDDVERLLQLRRLEGRRDL